MIGPDLRSSAFRVLSVLASSSAALATGLAAPPSHRLLSAIIGLRPRGVTAPGHRPLSVSSATGPVSSSVARAVGLAATPDTGPSALSSAVHSSCRDLACQASCASGVRGRGKKKTLGKIKQRQRTTDDRRQKTPDHAVWCLGMLLLT